MAQAAVAFVFAAAALPAGAQGKFPSEAVNLVVGFPPGGSNDLIARIIAPRLSKVLGVPVVVLNKPGAAAAIGTAYTANAKPDGYTITLGSTSALSISPTVTKLAFKLSDLAAITTVALSTSVLAVNPAVPAKTLPELIALAKNKEVTLASAGTGGLSHLNIELLKLETKGKFLHVPYKGASPAMTDVVGGRVDGIIMDRAPLAEMIQAGRLRVLTGSKPLGEIASSDMIIAPWYAVMAPARTPKEVIKILHAAFVKAVNDPEVKESFAKIDMDVMTQATPEEAAAFIDADSARWAKVVQEAHISLQ